MSLTSELAQCVASTRFEHFPQAAVLAGKRAILDTLGAIIGGSQMNAPRTLTEVIRECGGREDATVIGLGLRCPAPDAALINGTAAHALDYDDSRAGLVPLHPSAPVLPAALAIAERGQAGGRDLLSAFIVGIELECRLARGLGKSHYTRGWLAAFTLQAIGSAAAAAWLLKLDAARTGMALGLAGNMAGGLHRTFGTDAKPFLSGSAARAGVLAALLAEKGFTADLDSLAAKGGFLDMFSPAEDQTPQHVRGWGDPWEIESPGLGVKKYPCCGATHRALDAIASLRRTQPIRAEAVEALEVHVPPGAASILIHQRPKSGVQAKFSMEYATAAAILDGRGDSGPGLASFQDEAVLRAEAQSLLARVTTIEDMPNDDHPGRVPTAVVVRLRGGQVLRAQTAEVRGAPGSPLAWDELTAKFRDCTIGFLSPQDAERVIEFTLTLEVQPDLGWLMGVVARPAGPAVESAGPAALAAPSATPSFERRRTSTKKSRSS